MPIRQSWQSAITCRGRDVLNTDYDLVLPTNGGHLTRGFHRLER
jgi:hypothetical protein